MFLGGLLFATQAGAADRTNVPLRNWGGFAINRDWTYDAVEKLVLAGLTNRVVLNTKPMSRLEMAKIVAQAVEKIRGDNAWLYNDRQDLEDLLYSLVEEFQPELAELGVEPALQMGKPPGFFFVKPLDKLQTRGAFATNDALLENSQGDFLGEGISSRLALFSRAQVGGFLSLALHPEFRLQERGLQGRLLEGYVKLTRWGLEVEVGRESLWWGPGFHGSMLFSNNAQPLDMVRFSTEAFVPPWLFKYLGPTKLTLVVAQLEEDRDFPHAKIGAFRINISPFSFLEFGFSPAIQFGGRGRPTIGFLDIPELLFKFSDSQDTGSGKFNINVLFSLDATLRLRNVDRFLPLPIARDLEFYGELGVDDVHYFVKPILFRPTSPARAFLVGAYIPNFFRSPSADFRLEYAETRGSSFTHTLYTSGFSFKGRPLAHFIGTRGQDLYARFTRWIGPNLLLGLELNRAEIGSTVQSQVDLPRERRLSAGFDLSYRLSKALTLFGAYRFSHSQDLDFTLGRDADDHLLRLEATYSF